MSETRPRKSREAFGNILRGPAAQLHPGQTPPSSQYVAPRDRTRYIATLTKDQHRALRQLALDHDLDASAIIRGALAAIASDPRLQAKVLDAARRQGW